MFNIFLTDFISELFHKIMENELSSMDMGVLIILVIGLLLLFYPSIIVYLTILIGDYIKINGIFEYFIDDFIISYLLGFVGALLLIYIIFFIISFIRGKFMYIKKEPSSQELKLYDFIYYQLPKLHMNKKEDRQMKMELFLRRKKVIKYVFDGNMDTYLPKGVTEELRDVVVSLKEIAIQSNIHSLNDNDRIRFEKFKTIKGKQSLTTTNQSSIENNTDLLN